jgi:hypothetical protein
MRSITMGSGLWILANVALLAGPQLYGRLTGWYTYVNPSWLWYVWVIGPPAGLLLGGWGWRLWRRRSSGAAV